MGVPVAGFQQLASVAPREILYAMELNEGRFKPGGIIIDGTNGQDGGNTLTYDLRPGWPMGRITATGKYVPLKRTRVNMASATVTALVVDNAAAFKGNETISVGADTGLVVTAVNYATNTLTIPSTAVVDNEEVIAEDGSAIFRGFLYDFCRLRNLDNTAAADCVGKLLITGKVDQAYLLGDIAALIGTASSHYLNDIQIWSAGVRVL